MQNIRGTKTLGVEISQLFHRKGHRDDMPFVYWRILVALVIVASVQCCDMPPNTYSLQHSLSLESTKSVIENI